MEYSQQILDLTGKELDEFDDGGYYDDEQSDGGLVTILCVMISCGFFLPGFVYESWLIAAPGFVIYIGRGIVVALKRDIARLNRLRTAAQLYYTEEAARQAEEEMV